MVVQKMGAVQKGRARATAVLLGRHGDHAEFPRESREGMSSTKRDQLVGYEKLYIRRHLVGIRLLNSRVDISLHPFEHEVG